MLQSAFPPGQQPVEETMKFKTLALAGAFALCTTLAFAQAGGSSQAGGSAASKTTTGGGTAMKNGATGTTTGSSMPSAKDSSTQGAGTAGSAERKGDATTPGGMMKK
jgi:hypothetical protein